LRCYREARGELLEKFNAPQSPHFLFMLSTRAGGMGQGLALVQVRAQIEPLQDTFMS
jgi:hypothetical protein